MKLRMCTLLMLVALSGTTHAAFYVDEDAPQQTAVQPSTISRSQAYDVPFYIKRSQLGRYGRKALQGLLNNAKQSDTISITGYGDARNTTALARQRANSIRQWLVQNGVESSKIVVVESSETNPSETLNVFNSTVALSRYQAGAGLSPERQRSASLVRTSKEELPPIALASSSATPQAVINDPVKLAIAHKLVALGQNKVIKPEDAMVLLAEFLKNQDSAATAPMQVSASQLLAPAPVIPQVVPTAEVPQVWTLSSGKTLKENIDEWARIAGWEKPIWDATNQYQITFSSTMNGTFLEVLGQISKAVPELDIQVWKNKRVFRIANGRQ